MIIFDNWGGGESSTVQKPYEHMFTCTMYNNMMGSQSVLSFKLNHKQIIYAQKAEALR